MNDNLSAEERIATFTHIDIPALARGIERVREDLKQLEELLAANVTRSDDEA